LITTPLGLAPETAMLIEKPILRHLCISQLVPEIHSQLKRSQFMISPRKCITLILAVLATVGAVQGQTGSMVEINALVKMLMGRGAHGRRRRKYSKDYPAEIIEAAATATSYPNRSTPVQAVFIAN
jgi:hypothetical protein